MYSKFVKTKTASRSRRLVDKQDIKSVQRHCANHTKQKKFSTVIWKNYLVIGFLLCRVYFDKLQQERFSRTFHRVTLRPSEKKSSF